MMNQKWKNNYIKTELGRCLTQYRHIGYQELCNECILFFSVPQFRSVDHLDLFQIERLNIKTATVIPECGNGQKVYGVLSDGSVVKMIEIVDSSD